MGIYIKRRLGYGHVSRAGSSTSVKDLVNEDSIFAPGNTFKDAGFGSAQEAWKSYLDFTIALSNGEITHDFIDGRLINYPLINRDEDANNLRRAFLMSDNEYEENAPDEVVMLTPLSMVDDWSHNDDDIDYVHAMLNGTMMKDTVQESVYGFFPYDGRYMHADTLERLDRQDVHSFRNRIGENSIGESSAESQRLIEYYVKQLGFESQAEAEEKIAITPPDEIMALALWGKLFKDEKYVYTMKPLLYTYWS